MFNGWQNSFHGGAFLKVCGVFLKSNFDQYYIFASVNQFGNHSTMMCSLQIRLILLWIGCVQEHTGAQVCTGVCARTPGLAPNQCFPIVSADIVLEGKTTGEPKQPAGFQWALSEAKQHTISPHTLGILLLKLIMRSLSTSLHEIKLLNSSAKIFSLHILNTQNSSITKQSLYPTNEV